MLFLLFHVEMKCNTSKQYLKSIHFPHVFLLLYNILSSFNVELKWTAAIRSLLAELHVCKNKGGGKIKKELQRETDLDLGVPFGFLRQHFGHTAAHGRLLSRDLQVVLEALQVAPCIAGLRGFCGAHPDAGPPSWSKHTTHTLHTVHTVNTLHRAFIVPEQQWANPKITEDNRKNGNYRNIFQMRARKGK